MERKLKLYIPKNAYLAVPFPNSDEPIEILSFRYNATRMGSAPTINATFYYPTCLDNMWNGEVFAMFNGEKYYLRQTPASSFSNEEALYKYEIDLVSERIVLENVYFYDTVTGGAEIDKPVSHSTKVVFFGTIDEFIQRVSHSLAYCGLSNRYNIVIDDGVNIETEGRLVALEDKKIKEVLDEMCNIYETPYYFTSNNEVTTIHIGYRDTVLGTPFEYGADRSLVSVSKRNDKSDVVTKVTGCGSADNIPYYYPNNSPKGNIAIETNREELVAEIIDGEKYAKEIETDGIITYTTSTINNSFYNTWELEGGVLAQITLKNKVFKTKGYLTISCYGEYSLSFQNTLTANITNEFTPPKVSVVISRGGNVVHNIPFDGTYSTTVALTKGTYDIETTATYEQIKYRSSSLATMFISTSFSGDGSGWNYKNESVELKEIGVKIASGAPVYGDTITQRFLGFVNTSDRLMPYIYRATDGKERFYKAITGGYTVDNDYEVAYDGFQFITPYSAKAQREKVLEANEDIKPTIAYRTNVWGQRMDLFRDIAFDQFDNNDTIEDEEGQNLIYKHSLFFVKLPRLGFNIFDYANEKQPMKIAMTSGACGACEFEIMVDKDTQKNTVQIDTYGRLVRDANGDVVCGREKFQPAVRTYQASQQDTTNNEVWVALKKDESTFGTLMPCVRDNTTPATLRPSLNDRYVILGITMPQLYITLAERELESNIKNYLKKNNEEKVSFNVSISRVYIAENEAFISALTENSQCRVKYNNKTYDVYVNGYTYEMNADEPLPKITVDLGEMCGNEKNKLEMVLWQVNNRFAKQVEVLEPQIQAVAQSAFVSKLESDRVEGVLDFTKGVRFGNGGAIEVLSDNSAKLTIDYLEVNKKATFNSLEIKERTSIGGQLIVSSASMRCNKVELDASNNYKCYFQTDDETGAKVFNQFSVGDLAICQTFNTWGSRYYWRRVIEVGADYITLSYSNCATGSDAPAEGDTIVQLGNAYSSKKERQSAIIISASGENAPSWVVYNGINDFSLDGKAITGSTYNGETNEPQFFNYGDMFIGDKDINSPNATYITYQKRTGDTKKKLHIQADVTLGAGSTGLSNLSEWNNLNNRIDEIEDSIGEGGLSISNVSVTYIASTSGTSVPTSGNWVGSIVETNITKGKYLWTRTVITYTDNTQDTSYSVSYYSNDGTDGRDGADGRGIVSTVIEYGQSQNGTNATSVAGWSASIPSVNDGWYLWTRVTINYTSGSPSVSYSVSKDAKDGVDGKGITSTVIAYAVTTTSAQPADSSFSTTRPAVGKGQYLWTRTAINYTSGNPTVSYVVSYSGMDGSDGADGSDGNDGVSANIVSERTLYAISEDGVNVPSLDEFNEAAPYYGQIAKGWYLWSMHEIVWNTGQTTRSYTVVRNPYDGENGEDGNDGLNVAEVTMYKAHPKDPFKFTVSTPSGAGYAFDEYMPEVGWISTNRGIANSASVALVTIDLTIPATVTIRGTVSGEPNYDMGIFGKVNTDIGTSYNTASNLIEYTVGSNAGSDGAEKDFECPYSLPAGRSTIMVKYKKDGSQDKGEDCLTFGVECEFGDIPDMPRNDLTYTFSNGSVTGNLNGWSLTRPTMGANYLWQTSARVASKTPTVIIPANAWRNPVIIAYNNDMEYLADAFPFVQSVNGASIAQLVGVKGAGIDDPIVAGINGSDIGRDYTHGKLLFFSGASSVQNGVVNNAKTKIYEDGHFVTESGEFRGKMEAESIQLKVSTPNTAVPIDGAFIDIYRGGTYILPVLSTGQYVSIEAFGMAFTKSDYSKVVTLSNGGAANVYILDNGDASEGSLTTMTLHTRIHYRIFGYNSYGTTYWSVCYSNSNL